MAIKTVADLRALADGRGRTPVGPKMETTADGARSYRTTDDLRTAAISYPAMASENVRVRPAVSALHRAPLMNRAYENLSQGRLTLPDSPQGTALAGGLEQAAREADVLKLTGKLSSLQKESGKLDGQYTALMQDLGGFVPTGPYESEAAELRRQITALNRQARETERALVKKQQEAKWARYRALTGAEDFERMAARGGDVQNPSFGEAEGGLSMFNWRPFGKEPGNIVTYSRENYDRFRNSDSENRPTVGSPLYHWMTGDEVKLYNYLLAKEGAESAGAFLKDLEETLNSRFGTHQGARVRGIENPAARTLATGGFGVAAGLDQWAGGVRQLGSEERLPTSPTQFGSAYIREDLRDTGPKIFGSSLGQMGYDAVTTTGNMAPSILVGSLTGGMGAPAAVAQGAGAAALGASAAGNAYNQALGEGYGKDEAMNYAALVGASETTLQYLLGGIGALGGKATGKAVETAVRNIDNALFRIAGTIGVRMAGEGAEEYLQEILEPALRNLAFDERNQIRLVSEDAAYSFLLGALTAGLMEGPGTARTELGRTRVDSAIDRAYGAMGEHGLFSPEAGAAVQRTNRVLELPIFGGGAGKRASPLHITPDGVVMMPGAPGQSKTASTGEAASSLVPLSDIEKQQLSTGKNNVVSSVVSDIVAFVKTALSQKGGPARLYMGKIPVKTAMMVREATGVDISGYNAILPGDSIQHIYKHHGDEFTEDARGQRAVTPEDFAKLPRVIVEPDNVMLADGPDVLGRKVLMFSKQIGDTFITAQAVTDGRHALTTSSLWVQKKKNPQGTTHNADVSADPVPNAQSVPPQGSSSTTIPQRGSGVKGGEGPKGWSLPMAGGERIDTFVPWPYNEEKGGTQHGGEEATTPALQGISGDVLQGKNSRPDAGGIGESRTPHGAVHGRAGEGEAGSWAQGHLIQTPAPSAAIAHAVAKDYVLDVFVVEDVALRARNSNALALTSKGAIYISNELPIELAAVVPHHEVVHAVKQRQNGEYQAFLHKVEEKIEFSGTQARDILRVLCKARFNGRDYMDLSTVEIQTIMDELNALIWGYHKADPKNARTQFSGVFTDYDAYISELDAIMERVRRQRAEASAVSDRRDKAIEEGFADEKPPDARSEEDIDRFWEAAIADTEAQEQVSLLNAVIKNSQIKLEDVRANPSVFEGETAQDIAEVLRAQGYKVRIVGDKANVIKVDNPGGGRNIAQVEISPGGGRHRPNPYVKISTSDQGIIKIVFGNPQTYITDGTEAATIIFAGSEWYD